jgi:uncharacterized protein (TIGR02145 family)
MTLNNQQTPLVPSNGIITIDGVKYYRLNSSFNGDETLLRELSGEDMDDNFYFLRGYDIKTIDIDENRRLVFSRVDENKYDPIIVDISEEKEYPEFVYDAENGVITVTYPDGTIDTIGGFVVEKKYIEIFTDSTIIGSGSKETPLCLSPMYKSGMHAPIDDYKDLTINNTDFLGDDHDSGYRVLTKEKIDNFGGVFSLEEVLNIQKQLEENNSPWRIPTKNDWDDLLNAIECVDSNEDGVEDRNHSSSNLGWFGVKAGSALKSSAIWAEETTPEDQNSVAGQDICGLSVFPLAYVTNDGDLSYNEQAHTNTAFWSTTNFEGGLYGKVFDFNHGGVGQYEFLSNAKLYLRLVKDLKSNNYDEYEYIFGEPYATKIVRQHESVCDVNDVIDYKKIWTTSNLRNTSNYDESFGPVERYATVYVINEWDGTTWQKRVVSNGETMVIKTVEVNNVVYSYNEWRLIDGELVNLTYDNKTNIEAIKGDIKELATEIDTAILSFSAATVAEIKEVKNDISALDTSNKEIIAGLENSIEVICGSTIDYIDGQNIVLEGFVNSSINELDDELTQFKQSVEATIENLSTLYDSKGAAEIARITAEENASAFTTNALKQYSTISYVDDKISELEVGNIVLNGYAKIDDVNKAKNEVNAYTDTKVSGVENTSKAYTDSKIIESQNTAKAYADTLAKNYDTAGSAASAATVAIAYADSLVANYDASGVAQTFADIAETNAKTHTDTEIGKLSEVYEIKGSAASAETAAKAYADSLAKNYDVAGASASAETAAKAYADGLAVNYDIAGAAASAETAAKAYADSLAKNYDTAGSAASAATVAMAYADSLVANYDASGVAQTFADLAETNAKVYADAEIGKLSEVYEIKGAAISAETAAKTYADGLAVNYDIAGAAASAETTAKAYADSLAKNYDVAGAAASAETAAKNYTDNKIIDSQSAAKTYADSLAKNYDVAGASASAETAAKAYADGLAVNYDVKGAAASAETAAKKYTDTCKKEIIDSAKTYTDNSLSQYDTNIRSYIDSTNKTINTNIDTKIALFSGDVKSTIDRLDAKDTEIVKEINNIDKKINDKISTDFLYDSEGWVTNLTTGSLIKKVVLNGESKYYVPKTTNYLVHDKYQLDNYLNTLRNDLTNVISNLNTLSGVCSDYKIKDLANKVTTLENDYKEFERRLDALENFNAGFEERVRNIVLKYFEGTDGEIEISESRLKINLGFDDNAVFGDTTDMGYINQ